jgi:hypothetical protein
MEFIALQGRCMIDMSAPTLLIASFPALVWFAWSLWFGLLGHILASALQAPPFCFEQIPFHVSMSHRLASYGFKYGRWIKGTKRVYELVRPSKDVLRKLHTMEVAIELRNAKRATIRMHMLVMIKWSISIITVAMLTLCVHVSPGLPVSPRSGCPIVTMLHEARALTMAGCELARNILISSQAVLSVLGFAMSYAVPALVTTLHSVSSTLLAVIPAIAPMVDPCHPEGVLRSSPEAASFVCVTAPSIARSIITPVVDTMHLLIITLLDIVFRTVVGGIMLYNHNHTIMDQIRAFNYVINMVIPVIPIVVAISLEWWRSAQSGLTGKHMAQVRYMMGWTMTAACSYVISLVASHYGPWSVTHGSQYGAYV